MAVGLMLSVMEAIKHGPEGGPMASVTMAGLDPRDPSKIYRDTDIDFSERALQYWPKTFTDDMEIGWNFKDMAGASSALAQWSSNNGRTITFDIQLSRFMAPVETKSDNTIDDALTKLVDVDSPRNNPHNVNIADYIRFLRGFCYPTYVEMESAISALPPPIMILNVPNMGLNESGDDSIFAVMTGCNVAYNLCFRDGTPRRVTVSVTLRQVIQESSGIKFKGHGAKAPGKYDMNYAYRFEPLNRSAGKDIRGKRG